MSPLPSIRGIVRETLAPVLYGLAGAAVCAGILSSALALASLTLAALAIHLVAVPIVFGFVSIVYFRGERPLPPFGAALVFGAVTFALDVATTVVFRRSFDVTGDILAIALPAHVALLATWITGLALSDHTEHAPPHSVSREPAELRV